MGISEHLVLPHCPHVGERATSLPTLPHKTDVVASVLPAPSVRGCVTSEQAAQATKVVLNKTISCWLIAQQHYDVFYVGLVRRRRFSDKS